MYANPNYSCSNCRNFATKFCTCRDTATPLCDYCSPMHEYSLHNENHDWSPIDQLPILYGLGSTDAFRMQKLQLSQGTNLIRELEQYEMQQYLAAKQRIETASRLYTQWLDYLHRCFQDLVTRFDTEKNLPLTTTVFRFSQFTFSMLSLGDVHWPQQAEIVESGPAQRFESEIATLQVHLQQNCGHNSAFEEYFIEKIKSTVSSSPPVGQLSVLLPPVPIVPSRQPIAIIPKRFSPFVPFCRGKQLALWDSKTTDLKQITLAKSLKMTNLTVTVVLPNGNIVCCGGKDDQEQRAVMISTSEGKITNLPDMVEGRSNPGIVYADGFVYVFGGFQSGGITKLASAEKFEFSSQKWSALRGRMSSVRYQFSPCVYERKIYIAGGWETDSVEQYDIVAERFSKLPFSLPKPFGTIALGFNGELIIIQDTKLIRWRIGGESQQTQEIALSAKDSNVCPQIFGIKAYYTRETDTVCEIHALDLTTWEVERVANLSKGPNIQCPVE